MTIRDEIQRLQADIDELEAMAQWLHERVWPDDLPRCQHRHATMVQCAGSAWFVTWQCDDCGAPLADRPVTMADIDHGRYLPHFDADLYRRGLDRIEHGRTNTMTFFGRAVRR